MLISEVKQKICNKNQEPIRRQRLIFNGRILEDNLALVDYGVEQSCKIHLVLGIWSLPARSKASDGSYNIYVKTLDGRKLSLTVDDRTKVIQVKKILEPKLDVSLDQMRLIYYGRQMEDDKPLYYYDLYKDTTIHMIVRLKGC